MPTLHFGWIPRNYAGSLFVQPPDFEAVPKTRDAAVPPKPTDGPDDNGYCELCSCTFQSAIGHRNSGEHLRRAMNIETFAVLDHLIRTLPCGL
jgi:hypothetical protein